MASISSQGSTDSETRFSELLNPSRDLCKNWKIDLVETLQEYLNELALHNLDFCNGESELNFAEAALIVQGSTSVYGKKVDFVFNLASQLFQRLINEYKAPVSSQEPGREKDIVSGRNCDEFAALDDLKKGSNLDLPKDNPHKINFSQKVPFTPLALMQLEDSEKGDVTLVSSKGEVLGNKKDFQLNICSIHKSGILLLPSINYESYFENPTEEIAIAESADVGTNTMPESDDISDSECNMYESPAHSPLRIDNSPERMSPEPEAAKKPIANTTTPLRRSTRQALKAQQVIQEKLKEENKNAWNSENKDLPEFKKQIQKKNVKKLPKRLTKKRSTNNLTDSEGHLNSPAGFCSKAFFSHESKFSKKLCNQNNNKAFEQLLWEGLQKQKEILQNCRKKLNLNEDVEVKEEDGELNHDDSDDDDLGTDVLPLDDDIMDEGVDNTVESAAIADQSTSNPVAPDEIPVVTTYEELVRKSVENYMKGVAEYCQTSDLAERVNKWQEKIKPILENENNREPFDIHIYGTRIIDGFKDNNRKQSLPFSEVCKGKEKWEIARYFLASLQLANNRNVDICPDRQPDGCDSIDLTLLSRKRHHEELEAFGHNGGEH